jgi:hypothetical protein
MLIPLIIYIHHLLDEEHATILRHVTSYTVITEMIGFLSGETADDIIDSLDVECETSRRGFDIVHDPIMVEISVPVIREIREQSNKEHRGQT